MVRTEFIKGSRNKSRKNRCLKGNAIRGLSNYMLMANAAKIQDLISLCGSRVDEK